MPSTITDLRRFIDSVGGPEHVAARLGVRAGSVYGYAKAGRASPRWYGALCLLADEYGVARPGLDLFGMRALQPVTGPEQLLGHARTLENSAARLRAIARHPAVAA